jgi:hypothetical protein
MSRYNKIAIPFSIFYKQVCMSALCCKGPPYFKTWKKYQGFMKIFGNVIKHENTIILIYFFPSR